MVKNSNVKRRPAGRGLNFMVLLFITLIIIVAYYAFKPSLSRRLANGSWCVDKVVFGDSTIGPKTLHGIYMVYSDDDKVQCFEHLEFNSNGDATLPGINTRAVDGSWKMDNENTLKLNVDTLQNIYAGSYIISLKGDKLLLRSGKTIIEAHR